jgi:hypothetical protein
VQVIGPIDHGFIKSIYFGGPEGLSLEITCGHDIDANAWVDPEVVGLSGISEHEVEALKSPAAFERPATAVAQPAADSDMPTMHWPDVYELLVSLSDQDVWDAASEPTPPVIVD